MLRNYIKIAFKVMLRQKFFTGVSLFGISFTIMIFSITTVIFDLGYGDNAPAVNRSRTLYLDGISMESPTVPYARVNIGDDFYKKLRDSRDVENICIYKAGNIRSFKNGKVIIFNVSYTDEELWHIYNYTFLEGRPYNKRDIITGKRYAVISESTKKYYFGNGSAIGKYIGDEKKFQIIGVVKNKVILYANGPEVANILIPYSISTTSYASSNPAIILAKSNKVIPDIKDELVRMTKRIDQYKSLKDIRIRLSGGTVFEMRDFGYAILGLSIFLFFIVVIPALNLIGLNVNRISERSSEIGIRKAFGASSSVLAGQFIIENIIITFIGGILGVILTFVVSSALVRMIFYNSPESADGVYSALISWKSVLYSILSALFFGLVSGVIPAWRMSRLHAIKALKGGSAS
ncbi:ABC transporter permease [Pedobacter metabolipauper]|uniref:Putative ABC transport system permease protein n=1 Tax=Pedobacter metabolipauper TaxID=425513 RepID=A0A4R6SYK3_9SPHI|nr:ABC transporter permease [Pedobacter metabolipauper]TDQ09764.1 putative ABC transport system permease protein [Pedobacter metabolipauper]